MKQLLVLGMVGVCMAAAIPASAQQAQPPAGMTAPTNQVVLKVNDEPVYASDVSLMMRDIQSRQRGQKMTEQQLVEMATSRVIDRKLLAAEALKRGLKPDEKRIDSHLEQMAQQAGGREALDKFLATGGTDYDSLQQIVTESDLAETLIEKQIEPTITVTEDDVSSFYKDNPKMFERPEQVHARHILFKVAEDADAATVKAAHDKAEAARKRALAGEDFATLAKELSEGPSAPRGGDLGFFTHDQMVAPFADAAFALKPGQISDVVRTRYGFHVIKVEEKRDAGAMTLDEVHDRLKQVIQQSKTGEAVNKLLDELRKKATIVASQPAMGIQSPSAGN